MRQTGAILLALILTAAAVGGPAAAKTKAMKVDSHCVDDPTATPPEQRLICTVQGPGKFDISAEASFRNAAPGAWGKVAITLDDRPCGRAEETQIDGRGSAYLGCRRRKLEAGEHHFVVSVDYHQATFDGVQARAVRRP